ncbi:DNA-binding NarL/FixJ family response regulator [Silvibacterium bohemicum]|uniref:DNA-binding NarL/FixJ family response regulator n=1 Tax=Silvibacterium bohemicum TaxID=1577686 RepID=A0A841K2M6_9BACT|nr:response regulator transcription factor [Silvibacterium bohemicum]MBB6147265.1 DNA-binding NarL/FixJ family response regulator [Silvibacterium bohemicum]
MEDKIRLLLVDDHTLFREGLARLLEAESGLAMVGNFSSTEEALQSLEQNSVDVVLLDFDLGEKNSLQFLHSFRQQGFPGKILMVTAGISGADTFRVLKEGAAGVFLKHNPPAELITAINRVARGEAWMDPSSLNSLVGSTATRTQTPAFPSLSEREQGVLKGVFEGLTNKEIAVYLEISESYVKAVLQQLFAKTGVRTRSQLVRVALERRIE